MTQRNVKKPGYPSDSSQLAEKLSRFLAQVAETDPERGKRIFKLRKAAGFKNQPDFAQAVGVSPKTVSNWETGHNLEDENRERAAEVLGVDPELIDPSPATTEFLDEPTAAHAEQLDRIEEKLDEILKRLDEPAEADDSSKESERQAVEEIEEVADDLDAQESSTDAEDQADIDSSEEGPP